LVFGHDLLISDIGFSISDLILEYMEPALCWLFVCYYLLKT
jgi:hypothetical protein